MNYSLVIWTKYLNICGMQYTTPLCRC